MLVAKKERSHYTSYDNFASEKKNRDIARKRKNRKKVGLKLKIFGISIAIMLLCLSIVLRYAYITQYKYDITSLENEIIELNKAKQQLMVELEKIKDSEWIEREAIEELGLTYPTSEQTVFVSIGDEIENEDISIAKINEEHPVFLKAFHNVFDRIIGFIQ